jgi:hypothetical protein
VHVNSYPTSHLPIREVNTLLLTKREQTGNDAVWATYQIAYIPVVQGIKNTADIAVPLNIHVQVSFSLYLHTVGFTPFYMPRRPLE